MTTGTVCYYCPQYSTTPQSFLMPPVQHYPSIPPHAPSTALPLNHSSCPQYSTTPQPLLMPPVQHYPSTTPHTPSTALPLNHSSCLQYSTTPQLLLMPPVQHYSSTTPHAPSTALPLNHSSCPQYSTTPQPLLMPPVQHYPSTTPHAPSTALPLNHSSCPQYSTTPQPTPNRFSVIEHACNKLSHSRCWIMIQNPRWKGKINIDVVVVSTVIAYHAGIADQNPGRFPGCQRPAGLSGRTTPPRRANRLLLRNLFYIIKSVASAGRLYYKFNSYSYHSGDVCEIIKM